MGYKEETFTRDFHLIRQTLVFFIKNQLDFFLVIILGVLVSDFSREDSHMKQPWNARRIWSRLVYSGRKTVVLLPIEISFGVVLNIPVVMLCWAITQFIPHLWYISHKALVTDDTMFSSVESNEGKATPRGAKFHFLRAFSSVAYEIHPRDSPPPSPHSSTF